MDFGIAETNVNGGDAVEVTTNNAAAATNPDHGWQKVTYAKRQKKTAKPSDPGTTARAAVNSDKTSVFRSLEQQAEERHRRIVEAQQVSTAAAATVRSKHGSDDEDDDDSEAEAAPDNGKAGEAKKPKQKKPKKPKITVVEAAAKIDAADLGAFLVDVSVSDSELIDNYA